MGVVNCANSLCHGSVQPWKDSDVLQTEYVTWSRVDKHARAYRVLSTERRSASRAISGSKKPANQAKLCLDCHAHNVPVALRGERFRLDDGVSLRGVPRPGRALAAVARRSRARRTPTTSSAACTRPTIRSRVRGCACRATSATRTASSRTG